MTYLIMPHFIHKKHGHENSGIRIVDLQRFCEDFESRILSSFTFFFCTCFFSSPPSCSFLAVDMDRDKENFIFPYGKQKEEPL